MASAFWTLEDGRTMARRWTGMTYMLDLITNELKELDGAQEFYEYLVQFVIREDLGDEYNGCGGFVRDERHISISFDLRTFAAKNRELFWTAPQKALAKLLVLGKEEEEGMVYLLTTLLDMHKRTKKGEDPMLFNHLREVEPRTEERNGPGW